MNDTKSPLESQLQKWLAIETPPGQALEELVVLLSPSLAGHDPMSGLDTMQRLEAVSLRERARYALTPSYVVDDGDGYQPAEIPADVLVDFKADVAALLSRLTADGDDCRLLTKREAADRLHISERKLDYLRKRGGLQVVKLGGSVRFRVGDIQTLIRKAAQ
jgi:hypothetical protein